MRCFYLLVSLAAVLLSAAPGQGESLWARRNPKFAYLFKDTRARSVGDVLTIVVREATLFDGSEDRQMNKVTKAGALLNLGTAISLGDAALPSLGVDLTGGDGSNKSLLGKADYKSDRTFLDRMSVVVMDVLPNGNLVIEGYRERIVAGEKKMLVVSGVVRPIDIAHDNVVESQYIANFSVRYSGSGPETQYTNHGWWGRFCNWAWPF